MNGANSQSVIVAQLGSRQDYTVPLALQDLGVLRHFYTDTYFNKLEVRLLRVGGRSLRKGLSRHHPALDSSRVTRLNRFGLKYRKALRACGNAEEQHERFLDYGSAFNKEVLRRSPVSSSHVYAFDHAARDLFKSPVMKGRQRVLDQIYPAFSDEKIQYEEERRWPGWGKWSFSNFYESPVFQKWRDIQYEEWDLADTIIVASEYSKQSVCAALPEITHKVKIVPLTVNLTDYERHKRVRRHRLNRPLRVLFVGTVSLRKGLPYLLSAFEQIDPSVATLRVVGPIQLSPEKIRKYAGLVEFCGPVPHAQIPITYSGADIFVFPTVSDGFGAVMLEAMATGLPVISTDHCGDVVADGVNGYRIPIRDVDAIRECIQRFATSPDLLEQLSVGAIETVEKFRLANYQRLLCTALGIDTDASSPV